MADKVTKPQCGKSNNAFFFRFYTTSELVFEVILTNIYYKLRESLFGCMDVRMDVCYSFKQKLYSP